MTIAIILAGLVWTGLYVAHLRRLDMYLSEQKRLERGLRERSLLQSDGSEHSTAGESSRFGSDDIRHLRSGTDHAWYGAA